MKILITGAKGMVGTALAANLKNIMENKNRTRPGLQIEAVYEYDVDSTPEELDDYCAKADFVFNLAGVNRPENPEDFMKGNFGFGSFLLDTLKNTTIKPVLCFPLPFRLPWPGVLATRSTGEARGQGRSCFLSTAGSLEQRWRFIVSPT